MSISVRPALAFAIAEKRLPLGGANRAGCWSFEIFLRK